ncbi:hypothetical protein ACTFIR_012065 [Dictyostelium discoideum]
MNNNIENEDDIGDSELEKKDMKSIREIAKSYSISTYRLKKAEIIEKIKSEVKRKREYEEEEKKKQNANSFNNNNIENKDDIHDYSELEKKNLKSIKEIAQSYSISTTKLKKAEIIEKIKSVVKRKRENEEEEQKQNANSFNNNNIENEDDIDDSGLEKKDLKSIKEIAQSYSISTNRLKKAEIIEKIKSIVKRKREYEEEEKQKQNVNSFNKIIKLTITDKIEPIEILFWKLFRNKTIYKKIFSFMDNQFSITYDSMSSITQLIDSNQFGIIKEKVYRNCRYLQFNTSEYYIDNSDEIKYLVKLFSKINDDDYRFYKNFFNIENEYFNSSDAVLFSLIISKKLEMFKLFINEFKYTPTKIDLLHSIIVGSKKFIKYILELNSPNYLLLLDNDNNEIIKDFKLLIGVLKDSFYKGLLFYLNYIGNDKYDRNKYFQLLISFLTHGRSSIERYYEINEKSTLKSLITTARLILKLKTPQPPIKDEEKKLSKNITKPIEGIEEIDNFINKINKSSLKSLLNDPINFNNNNNNNNEIKNFIKKLLILYQLTFGFKLPKNLYFWYYYEESNDDFRYKVQNIFKNVGCDFIEIPFIFGIYEILEEYPINIIEIKEYFERIIKNKDRDDNFKVLFSYCNDRNRKIKIIDKVVERTTKQLGHHEIQCYFLYLLVIHNDIELVKYYSNKVGNHIQGNTHNSLLPPTYFIESIEMLEFLFYNQCNYFTDIKYNDYISTHYKNLELLKHFESLWEKSKSLNQLGSGTGSVSGSGSGSGSSSDGGSRCGIHFYNGPVSFAINGYFDRYYSEYLILKRNKNYSDFFNHFASSPQLYCNDKFRFELLDITSELSYKNPINFQTLRNLVIDGHAFVKEINEGTVPYSNEFLKFMDWVYTNYNDDLENGGIFAFKEEKFQYHLLIAIDRYDFNNDNCIVNKYYNGNEKENTIYLQRLITLLKNVKQLTPYLFEINNFKFLNWVLTIVKKYHYSSSSNLIKSKLKILVVLPLIHIRSNSKLQILEFIHQNFNFILKKDSDGGILNIKQLKKILYFSLEKGKVKICKFYFQFISITKREFEKHSCQKSKKYIKYN